MDRAEQGCMQMAFSGLTVMRAGVHAHPKGCCLPVTRPRHPHCHVPTTVNTGPLDWAGWTLASAELGDRQIHAQGAEVGLGGQSKGP